MMIVNARCWHVKCFLTTRPDDEGCYGCVIVGLSFIVAHLLIALTDLLLKHRYRIVQSLLLLLQNYDMYCSGIYDCWIDFMVMVRLM